MSAFKNVPAGIRSLERTACQNAPRAVRIVSCLPRAAARGTTRVTSPSASRSFTVLPRLRQEQSEAPHPSGIAPAKAYSYQDIADLTFNPSPNRILIDVREPSELLQTGRIPTAKSVPISSAPDAFFMSAEDFETKFGFPRPSEGDEVIFYCKAGVRSRQAALLAGQARPAFGGKIGNYHGSWIDWEKNGGKVEKEGDQGEESSVSGVTNPGQGVPGTPRP
ncbi:Thiosulfate sulfurtransferase rdl2, mitochondrial [Neophaeococcomyces mojaviensis]|uniref:Thiosulfate sulfurtransferase rdl2, mitochondrial n=1 Tax=Neophaeococcomyces mojaviensis TaxID=3383035 RepID=A0ACC3A1S6_9EURO|nr:Thiosulfate sulfurtransferase rdl2, mitochondrial [Knufia sp. JES_112]